MQIIVLTCFIYFVCLYVYMYMDDNLLTFILQPNTVFLYFQFNFP